MVKQKEITKPKEGIENFIIKKLEKAHTIDEIRVILVNAGFSKMEIEQGLSNVKRTHKTFHQDIAASNNFLPTLKKVFNGGVDGSLNINIKKHSREKVEKRSGSNLIEEIEGDILKLKHIGLFAGRIRRKDFIVAILFLFSLFFSTVIILASFIDALYPESWRAIGDVITNDSNGVLFLFVPIVFAPFTLMFLSLTTRRLHDLGLPGILSFLYLAIFIYPFSEYVPSGMLVFDCVLAILFFFLLSKLGPSEPNKYGKLPTAHGSTFAKILNLK